MSRTTTKSLPVLTDNSLNRAFSVKYAIYSAFGLSGIITHIPSLSLIAGEAVATILAAVVAVAGALASIAAWNFIKGGKWIKREFYATIFLVSFVGMYDIALIILTFLGEGDRLNLAIIASALLVMPIWRIRYILKSTRQ